MSFQPNALPGGPGPIIPPVITGSVWGMTTYLPNSGVNVANLLNLASLYIPVNCTITGIQIGNAGVISGNVKSALYNSSGSTLLGSSGSVAQAGAWSSQLVPFTTPAVITSGEYILGIMPDNATATFLNGSPINPVASPTQGSFTIPSSVTPPAATTRFYIITMATY